MLENSTLRERARNDLKNSIFSEKWLMTTLAVFVVAIIFGVGVSAASLVISPITSVFSFAAAPGLIISHDYSSMLVGTLLVTFISSLFGYICAAAAQIFLLGPLCVGLFRYVLANRDPYDNETPNFSLIFSSFKKGEYKNVVKANAWKVLHVYLWLLIPIAGIVIYVIKSLEYFYVDSLLADNPELDPKYVLEKSSSMTDGVKGKLFVLWLSFIGWLLLGALCFGLGTPFASAYMYQAFAEAYDDRKKYCISCGKLTPTDIGFNLNGEPNDPFWQPLNLNNYYIRNRNYSRMANAGNNAYRR